MGTTNFLTWRFHFVVPFLFYVSVLIAVMCEIYRLTGGHFGYTLDDAYIHLALAERLAGGHYGINADEVASPSSSIVWPLILVVGSGTIWHPYLPLFINIACGLATVLVIVKMVDRWPWKAGDRCASHKKSAIVILFICAGNLVTLVFSGMEHSLQLLIVAVCAYGVNEALSGRRIPAWCLITAAAGPAIRYEMVAPLSALVVTLLGTRRWRAAAALCCGGIVPLVVFGLYLMHLGLPFLPSSVLAKSGEFGTDHGPIVSLARLVAASLHHLSTSPYKLLFLVLIISMGAAVVTASKERRWPLVGVFLALVGHFLVGRFGWFYRYELYAVLFGLLILIASTMSAPNPTRRWLAISLLAIFAAAYAKSILQVAKASENIFEQQYQMHRFVNEYYRKDVAVNDLGWMSYQQSSPFYVLDLAGLASTEALLQAHKDATWLNEITTSYHIGLVMIYPSWFESIPPSWRLMGILRFDGPKISAAERSVSFYATGLGDQPAIKNELHAFAPTLPANASMTQE